VWPRGAGLALLNNLSPPRCVSFLDLRPGPKLVEAGHRFSSWPYSDCHTIYGNCVSYDGCYSSCIMLTKALRTYLLILKPIYFPKFKVVRIVRRILFLTKLTLEIILKLSFSKRFEETLSKRMTFMDFILIIICGVLLQKCR
jgi:hypothetical protein